MTGARSTNLMVLVQDEQGAVYAVGPVARAETVDWIRDTAEQHGHTAIGQARKLSIADFNALMALGKDGKP